MGATMRATSARSVHFVFSTPCPACTQRNLHEAPGWGALGGMDRVLSLVTLGHLTLKGDWAEVRQRALVGGAVSAVIHAPQSRGVMMHSAKLLSRAVFGSRPLLPTSSLALTRRSGPGVNGDAMITGPIAAPPVHTITTGRPDPWCGLKLL